MQTIEKIGIDAQVIIDRLKNTEYGEVVSYSELCEMIGRKMKELPGPLGTARNRLMRDSSMVFGVVRGIGLKRLNDAEKIGFASANIDRVRRSANRGITVLQSINVDNLEKVDVSKLNLTYSHLGVLAYVSSGKARDKIEQKVIANNGKVPAGITLDALR